MLNGELNFVTLLTIFVLKGSGRGDIFQVASSWHEKNSPGFKSNTERKKIVSVSAHYSKRASKIYLNCVGFIISYSLQLAGFETHPPPSLLSQPRISKKNRLWLTTHSYLQNMLSQPSLTKWKSETGDWETEFSEGFE